jgi:hypothetical protein
VTPLPKYFDFARHANKVLESRDLQNCVVHYSGPPTPHRIKNMINPEIHNNPFDVLPEEMHFTLKIDRGWRIHMNERWGDAKKRFDKAYKREIKGYKKRMGELKAFYKRFSRDSFDWLIRRIVPTTESLAEISQRYNNVDPAEISRETNRLAKFLNLTIA